MDAEDVIGRRLAERQEESRAIEMELRSRINTLQKRKEEDTALLAAIFAVEEDYVQKDAIDNAAAAAREFTRCMLVYGPLRDLERSMPGENIVITLDLLARQEALRQLAIKEGKAALQRLGLTIPTTPSSSL